MKTLQTLIALSIFVGLVAGCGTIAGRDVRPETTVYPAVKFDVYVFGLGAIGLFSSASDRDGGHIPPPIAGVVMIPLSILDLPISLITDTILLPWDFVRVSAEIERESRMFNMDINAPTTNAPGIILLETSSLQYNDSAENTPWALFKDLSSKQYIKVVREESFGSDNSPDNYKLIWVIGDRVRVEKLKRKANNQQKNDGGGKPELDDKPPGHSSHSYSGDVGREADLTLEQRRQLRSAYLSEENLKSNQLPQSNNKS